ncbi:GGDEF domain-containing protein [Rhizobium sp. TRM96647]|uniref:GGDEF domain-containing protein n=1 Tax=unclassified Rhizobium TaxID=2613769 RepID=UPI0021E74E25|nr:MULTISPECIES: GGDEF domain-containing protein [unclassified Rhizobium]MCV3739419.1 GGDEF domain-containing protein [Rhizobium sp. TRM96647]MCV3761085.1 GGDEF domain-containing protein [Rhizobium sp. TRM96650]
MMLDYNSLLLALGFSAICLMVTLLGTWVSRRADSFLLTLVVALFFIVIGIFAFSSYTMETGILRVSLAYAFLMAGFSTIYAGSVQFQSAQSPWMRTSVLSTIMILPGLPLILWGLDGVAIIFMNAATAALLIGTGWHYWSARAEAPGPLIGMSFLYVLSGSSFVLCAAVLLHQRQWILGRAPDNWAENLNLAICIAGMSGIGALSLALHQWRLAARHRHEANTDPLTGLLNRRALFDKVIGRRIGPETAVVTFDIDRFKSINDQHGHAVGDMVIRAFAEELNNSAGGQQLAARLGGEEFVIILTNALPGRAKRVAGDIVRSFAAREIRVGEERLQCTVSAGIAFGSQDADSFEVVLNLADAALYQAKRSGRNRVQMAEFLHRVETVKTRSNAFF